MFGRFPRINPVNPEKPIAVIAAADRFAGNSPMQRANNSPPLGYGIVANNDNGKQKEERKRPCESSAPLWPA